MKNVNKDALGRRVNLKKAYTDKDRETADKMTATPTDLHIKRLQWLKLKKAQEKFWEGSGLLDFEVQPFIDRLNAEYMACKSAIDNYFKGGHTFSEDDLVEENPKGVRALPHSSGVKTFHQRHEI